MMSLINDRATNPHYNKPFSDRFSPFFTTTQPGKFLEQRHGCSAHPFTSVQLHMEANVINRLQAMAIFATRFLIVDRPDK